MLLSQVVIAYVIGQLWFADPVHSEDTTKSVAADKGSLSRNIEAVHDSDPGSHEAGVTDAKDSGQSQVTKWDAARGSNYTRVSDKQRTHSRSSNQRTARLEDSDKRLMQLRQMVAELIRELNPDLFRRVEAVIESHRIEFSISISLPAPGAG